VKRRTVIALTACVSLFALGGRAPAEVIIDEPFGTNAVINSPRSYAMVGMSMVGMWMGGTNMGDGMWWLMVAPGAMSYAEGKVNMAMGTGMGTLWNSLVYFVGKPQTGWGGNRLDFSFSYHTEDFPTGLKAKYGVYGWKGGETLNLEGEDPSGGGFELIGGVLSDGSEWHSVGGRYTDGLDAFNFIGATFSIGDTTGDGQPVSMQVDNVRLEGVPEPTSMLLWAAGMGTATYVLRRLRRRRKDVETHG